MQERYAERNTTTPAAADLGAAGSQDLASTCRQEAAKLQAEIMEMEILIRQTAAELERLEPRVSEATRKLREVESRFDSYTRAEVKEVYGAAQEVQMRHFMMQAQLGQLNHKLSVLQRFDGFLRNVIAALPQLQAAVQLETPGDSPASARHQVADYSADRHADDSALAQVVQAQEEERHRAAEVMNEGPVQMLANLVLRAEVCERLLSSGDDRALGELRQMKSSIASSLRDARLLVYELRPMALTELGLLPTLQKYAQNLADKTNVSFSIEGEGIDGRWPEYFEVAMFRVVQEAIAQSLSRRQVNRIDVKLSSTDSEIRVLVQDNAPHDMAERRGGADSRKERSGAARFRERLQLLGATAESEIIPGGGHRLHLAIPLR